MPNRDCEYGCRLGFADIRSVRDFQSRVPIVRYDDLRNDIDRITRGEQGILTCEPVRRFFLTSGSTADPKHIPVTDAFIRDKRRAFSIFWDSVFGTRFLPLDRTRPEKVGIDGLAAFPKSLPAQLLAPFRFRRIEAASGPLPD